MVRPQKILVILSRNELDSQPEPALERGLLLARETGAVLELFVSEYHPSIPVSLADKPLSQETYLRSTLGQLQAFSETLTSKENLAISVDVAWNRHQYNGVMQKVTATKPDLVIKTIRHDSSLNRALFNYTDWYLIRHCPCPMLLAKSESDWSSRRRILACVDPAHIHSQAETLDNVILETAELLAYRLRGELHILHAIELLPEPLFMLLQPESNYEVYKNYVRQEHEEFLQELLRPYGMGMQRLHIVEGKPTDALQPLVTEINASLVVMGAVSKGTLENLLIGNTAEKVLDTLSCDILIVKSNPIEVTDLATEALLR